MKRQRLLLFSCYVPHEDDVIHSCIYACIHVTDTYNLQCTHCRRGSSSSSHTSGSGLIFIIVITLYYVHILALLLSTLLISTKQDPVRYTIVFRGGGGA